ncbi:MAG TPA: FtsX-like permease family protein [Burkholderiales bacterium]|nr:FtsX-like permease family protein [Burkholderiales bacterium]
MTRYLPLLLAPLAQNKARLIVTVLAIALGVALGYAVAVINQSALGELSQALQAISGQAQLTIRGPRSGFDQSLYPQVAALPEVAVASPMVEAQASVVGRDEPLRLIGLDVFRAARIQPALLAEAEDPLDTLRPDTVFLSTAARAQLGAKIGDVLRVQVGLGEVQLRVAGWLPAGATPAAVGVMDIGAAQWRLGRLGRLTRIDLALRPGARVETVARRLQSILPPGVHAERPASAVHAAATLTRAYRVNLNVLALVALFTGGLLVFSTQALSVVRRRSHLALLRVQGMTRRALAGLLLAEGALVGVIGAALGLVLGFAAAAGVLHFVGADLGAGHFRGLGAAPSVEPWALALFFFLGVGAALLGSLAPALEAARAAPAQALKAGDDVHAFERLTAPRSGVALIAAGVLVLWLPPIDRLPVFGYASIALLLIGTITLLPRLMHALLRWMPGLGPVPAQLAHSQLRNAPGPATASLAPIVAAVSLTVSMAIMVDSFRHSLEGWLDHVLPADLYLRAGGAGDTAYLAPADQARIAGAAGVRRVEFLRSTQIVLDAARPPVTLLARDIDPRQVHERVPLVSEPASPAPAAPPVWVSEAVRDLYGFDPGEIVQLPIAGRRHSFTVAGVWRDYARQNGALLIERQVYVERTGDATVTDAGVWLEPGVTAAQAAQRLRALPGGEQLDIAEPAAVRELSLGIFDRTFAATYALEAAAILLGLFGLSSSVAARVLARRSELGMLRHIGMTRAQIAAMLTFEGVLTSAVGLLVGCALGALMSLVLIYVVNPQSFHWSMELRLPWATLATFCLVMLGLATLTALAGARQAMSGQVLRAVREDW